jgi:hypothetical protein
MKKCLKRCKKYFLKWYDGITSWRIIHRIIVGSNPAENQAALSGLLHDA